MRTLLSVVAAMVWGITCLGAAGEPSVNISLKSLAGAYGGSYGMAQIRGERVGIGTDGRAFADGKITYFSPAGFIVKFNSQRGPVEMKFVFQKGYPKSFFRDDGKLGVSVFTRI